jgi:hypothetical protein
MKSNPSAISDLHSPDAGPSQGRRGRWSFVLLAGALLAAPLEATAAPPPDDYFEFQILMSRGGVVMRDKILKVYSSGLGVRAEVSAQSAWLIRSEDELLISLDSQTKVARQRAWNLPCAALLNQKAGAARLQVAGAPREETLGDWKCTVYELRPGTTEASPARTEEAIHIWITQQVPLDSRRLFELLAKPNLGLANLHQAFQALPPGEGLVVRFRERNAKPPFERTFNLIRHRKVPHDPARYAVPKGYQIMDLKRATAAGGTPEAPGSSD